MGSRRLEGLELKIMKLNNTLVSKHLTFLFYEHFHLQAEKEMQENKMLGVSVG